MKDALREVMSQFYADGVPSDVVARAGRFTEVRNNATIVKGMRRTGKTYFTYLRMRELLASGIPIERIVHVNFDDDRLAAMTASDLHWLVDLHAEMFPTLLIIGRPKSLTYALTGLGPSEPAPQPQKKSSPPKSSSPPS